mmetsp:Transcript_75626/g.131082  ORF Transcript_75626/g.131082 Transcript_75626/m.131082 type:complete len:423 (-) Transcript_75626:678-1946(-)
MDPSSHASSSPSRAQPGSFCPLCGLQRASSRSHAVGTAQSGPLLAVLAASACRIQAGHRFPASAGQPPLPAFGKRDQQSSSSTLRDSVGGLALASNPASCPDFSLPASSCAFRAPQHLSHLFCGAQGAPTPSRVDHVEGCPRCSCRLRPNSSERPADRRGPPARRSRPGQLRSLHPSSSKRPADRPLLPAPAQRVSALLRHCRRPNSSASWAGRHRPASPASARCFFSLDPGALGQQASSGSGPDSRACPHDASSLPAHLALPAFAQPRCCAWPAPSWRAAAERTPSWRADALHPPPWHAQAPSGKLPTSSLALLLPLGAGRPIVFVYFPFSLRWLHGAVDHPIEDLWRALLVHCRPCLPHPCRCSARGWGDRHRQRALFPQHHPCLLRPCSATGWADRHLLEDAPWSSVWCPESLDGSLPS